MEEDIKVLEKLISKKYTKNLLEIVNTFTEKDNISVLSKKEIQAIENFIKEYKELEKYKKYYETEKVVWSRNDYISKDKIKEKIKENIKKHKKQLKEFDAEHIRDIIHYRIKTLEELENELLEGE